VRAGADQSALVGFKVECRRHTGNGFLMNRRCSPPRFPWNFVALARRVTQCCGLPEGRKQSSGERIDFSDFRFVTTMLDRGDVLRGDASR
jgi:hypothetical protein